MEAKLKILLLIIIVSILNIAFNIWLQKAAKYSNFNFMDGLLSYNFMVAMLIGTLSALTLLLLYSNRVQLASGVLLMGAISILGGSLFGVLYFNNKLHVTEWAIFFVLSILLIFRFYVKSS